MLLETNHSPVFTIHDNTQIFVLSVQYSSSKVKKPDNGCLIQLNLHKKYASVHKEKLIKKSATKWPMQTKAAGIRTTSAAFFLLRPPKAGGMKNLSQNSAWQDGTTT